MNLIFSTNFHLLFRNLKLLFHSFVVRLLFEQCSKCRFVALKLSLNPHLLCRIMDPVHFLLPVSEIKFINCVPTGSSALVDDIELFVR